jgi:hypothetical protein
MRNSAFTMARLPALNNLLWFDSAAAVTSGLISLFVGGWMARWFHFPRSLLTILACISVTYALYSGTLAYLRSRSRSLLIILVMANVAYAVWCCFLIANFRDTANILGIGYLALEALFVATLAVVEWQVLQREWDRLR